MAETQSFFTKLIASLFGPMDPEAEKRRRIKMIAKNLSKAKYHFYKNDEAQAAFAKFFYEIYKAIFPAKAMFMAQENMNRLKLLVLTYSLNEQQHAVIESLSEEAIKQAVTKAPVDQVKAQIEKNIGALSQIFTPEKIVQTESLYRKIVMFRNFCTYDFYFMLKKFDSSMREGDFNSLPKFEAINAEYLGEDLKDFLAVAWVLPEREDWSEMIKFFKETKGAEPVTLNIWNKIVNRVYSLKNSRVMEMMIQVTTKDPAYTARYTFSEPPIVDEYLDKIRSDASKTLNQLTTELQNSKIDCLLTQIFGNAKIERLVNYTAKNSLVFEKKNVGSFEYVQPLNFYKAFLTDFVKKDIREFCDLILVRGTWTTQALSAPMSNAFHSLTQSGDTLVSFDAKIAEDAEVGIRLKTYLPRTERDKEARNIIGTLIGDLNEEAKKLCVEGTKNLIVIAKTTKTLIDDYSRANGEVIINWKELEHFTEHPIKETAIKIYQNIYNFVSLMQNCLKA